MLLVPHLIDLHRNQKKYMNAPRSTFRARPFLCSLRQANSKRLGNSFNSGVTMLGARHFFATGLASFGNKPSLPDVITMSEYDFA